MALTAAWLAATRPAVDVAAGLAQAQTFARREGKVMWKGYGTAPFENAAGRPRSPAAVLSRRAALRAPDPAKQRRELANPHGVGEAMLIAACDPTWRERYPGGVGADPADRACAEAPFRRLTDIAAPA